MGKFNFSRWQKGVRPGRKVTKRLVAKLQKAETPHRNTNQAAQASRKAYQCFQQQASFSQVMRRAPRNAWTYAAARHSRRHRMPGGVIRAAGQSSDRCAMREAREQNKP